MFFAFKNVILLLQMLLNLFDAPKVLIWFYIKSVKVNLSVSYFSILLYLKQIVHIDTSIRNLFYDHLAFHNDTEHFYTDGSKSNHGVGCVAVSRSSVYSATLSYFNSSFTSEIMALLLLFKNIFFIKINPFTIFTDSKSSFKIF